ncbi:MAG: archaeosortase/exosortase family protein, partial [Candidatus Aenigmarchaeota archaeon]|nr:archaeosortase/exosortase family protein [Candidatus Aenigmarchaeota archaeon]
MHERKLLMLVRFVVIFNLLAIPMYAILASGTQLPALQEATTDVVFAIFRALGYTAERSGFTIVFTAPLQAGIVIDTDCTGWKSMYAFAALVIATPFAIGWKRRSMIVALGVAALFALNIVRIVSTVAAAAAFGIGTLEVVHT